jgi:two-component system sensor histidine kinase/response regulator
MNDRLRSHRSGPPPFAPTIGLREVLEATPDLVFSTDAWGRLVWAAPTFESITGRKVKDCVGHPVLVLLAPAHARAGRRAFARARRTPGEPIAHRADVVKPDGRTVSLELRLRMTETPAGERYLIGTARQHVEPEVAEPAPWPVPRPDSPKVLDLVSHLAEARDTAEVKGEFLSTISQEMRTPMTGVLSMANLLLQGELSAEQRQIVELMRESTQTMLTLVNDSMDYSKLEEGRLEVDTLDFDLRVTVDQIAGVLHPLAIGKGLAFESRVQGLAPSRLKGDPGRVRQVLLNLGSNAIRFTEQGSVSVRVEREEEDDSEVTLLFQVTDTGESIRTDALAHVFEPQKPSDDPDARRYTSPGLGLALSRRLVEAMGGSMGVESDGAHGCTFWFRIRFEKQPVTVGGTATPAPEVALRGVRVLLADGHAVERAPVAAVLKAWGCDVELADNGPDALRLVRTEASGGEPFALALLDRGLEGLGGEELGQAIRADEDLEATQLIMITSEGRPGDGGRVKSLGFAGYLMKPLDAGQLYEAVVEVLNPGLADQPHADRPLVTRHSLAEARRGRLRILLVDDDAVNQLVTTSALHRVGYNVEVAHNGHRAIELTEGERWDLILMDMQMPDLDGCRTTSAIRARERGAWRTPIIGLTANADHKADRDRCTAAGMDVVLGKPINLELLTTLVEKYTSRDGRAFEPEVPAAASPKLTVVSAHFDAPGNGVQATADTVATTEPTEVESDGVPDLPAGPAIDLEQLEAACMGLPALRSSLLHTYMIDIPGRLERLRFSFDANDLRRVEFEAHGLRGMCATIGATGCTVLFGEMEDRARADRLQAARVLLEPAIAEATRTEDFIRRFDQIVAREAA